MKKILLAVVASLAFAGTSLAADFSHGQSPDGCYYFSEAKQIVYTKDASGITDLGHCLSARSTVWYAGNLIATPKFGDAYWNRIHAMKILLAK